jgi:hypothetical protein
MKPFRPKFKDLIWTHLGFTFHGFMMPKKSKLIFQITQINLYRFWGVKNWQKNGKKLAKNTQKSFRPKRSFLKSIPGHGVAAGGRLRALFVLGHPRHRVLPGADVGQTGPSSLIVP